MVYDDIMDRPKASSEYSRTKETKTHVKMSLMMSLSIICSLKLSLSARFYTTEKIDPKSNGSAKCCTIREKEIHTNQGRNTKDVSLMPNH